MGFGSRADSSPELDLGYEPGCEERDSADWRGDQEHGLDRLA